MPAIDPTTQTYNYLETRQIHEFFTSVWIFFREDGVVQWCKYVSGLDTRVWYERLMYRILFRG